MLKFCSWQTFLPGEQLSASTHKNDFQNWCIVSFECLEIELVDEHKKTPSENNKKIKIPKDKLQNFIDM